MHKNKLLVHKSGRLCSFEATLQQKNCDLQGVDVQGVTVACRLCPHLVEEFLEELWVNLYDLLTCF